MDNDFENQLAEFREKQALCKHTCFVCPQCRLHKDNLYNEQQIIIQNLRAEISRLNLLKIN